MVVLHLERLETEDDVEVGVQLGGGVAEIVEVADDALAGGLGDLVVVAPLADQVGAAVPADVERGRVLEAGAAVVGPHGHVGEIGDGADDLLQGLTVVAADDGMILRHRVAREAGAERMVDARAAERGIFLEKPVRHRARLEHAHARFQTVAAAEPGELAEMVEIGVEVERGPETLGQRRIHKVVKAGAVGVKLRVVFVRDEILVGHVALQAVDLAVSKAGLGERGHVVLGIEAAGGAPVLGVAGVPVRAMPAESGGEKKAGGEFFPGEVGRAVSEQADGGVKERTVAGGDFAGAVLSETEPHPGGVGCGGGGEGFRGRPGF